MEPELYAWAVPADVEEDDEEEEDEEEGEGGD